jgi:hypothetical protein
MFKFRMSSATRSSPRLYICHIKSLLVLPLPTILFHQSTRLFPSSLAVPSRVWTSGSKLTKKGSCNYRMQYSPQNRRYYILRLCVYRSNGSTPNYFYQIQVFLDNRKAFHGYYTALVKALYAGLVCIWDSQM